MNIKLSNNENLTVTGNINNVAKSVDVLTLPDIKQDTLVSGTNIKTINNSSILGSGNISVLDSSVLGDPEDYWNYGANYTGDGYDIVNLINDTATSIVQWAGNEFAKKSAVVWQASGTGLTALETDLSNNIAWQLTNLDMTPYKRIKVYTKAAQKSGTTASASTTASMVLEIPLDSDAAGPYGGIYVGSVVSQKPNDRNRTATLTCAVSADKTSFAVMRMTNLYGTAASDNSDVGGYVYLIEGYYDNDETGNPSQSLTKTPYVSSLPSASVTIDPYKMYDFGTVSTSMTIAFNTSAEMVGYTREYIIRFVAGSGCGITLPNGVLYAGHTTPTYTTGRTYEIDIVNNCAVVAEFY